jgi:putative transposase
VARASAVATGVRKTGERGVLGFAVSLSEDGPFAKEFLRSLLARGVGG